MSYDAVFEALRHRLLGGDPRSCPDYPHTVSPGRAGEIVLNGRRVYVVARGAEGSPSEARPLISYDVVFDGPRHDNWLPPQATYEEDVSASDETVTAPNGETFVRAGLKTVRQREEPIDYMIELRAYADTVKDTSLVSEYLYRVFPQRTFLRVPMKDGTWRSWDFILTEDNRNTDERQVVLDGSFGLAREGLRIRTYTLEGYLDNTTETVIESRVNEFVLDVEKQ